MQSYIERSRQIRNLSMPPENKEHFYGQFRVNFFPDRPELFAENRAYLNDEVFTPLKDIDVIREEKAQELLELSDNLAYTETLEMVDVAAGVFHRERVGTLLRKARKPGKIYPLSVSAGNAGLQRGADF